MDILFQKFGKKRGGWFRKIVPALFTFFLGIGTYAQNYTVPEINTPDDYTNKVYIDPSGSNGTGTINSPYNSFSGIDPQDNTAYLIKAGTKLNESINNTFSNNYIGKYGKGANPIVEGSLIIGDNSSYLTVDSLVINKYGAGAYNSLVRISDNSVHHITIANCEIVGLDNGLGYPYYGVKASGEFITYYHNIIAYTTNDGIYMGYANNVTIVSNYLHHNNMGGMSAINSTGDGIQLEHSRATNGYIANNFIDKSHTIWKFALIVNSVLSAQTGMVCEWNTFAAPRTGNGGSAVRWLGGDKNIFRKNLIDTRTGITAITGYPEHTNLDAPYGVRDNHKVGIGPMSNINLDASNISFANFEDYSSYLSTQGIEKYGSDLDTANFWGPLPNSPCSSSPISISGIVINDTANKSVGSITTTISGGYTGKSILWNTGATTQNISNLSVGTYSITVVDDSSCTSKKNYTVKNINIDTAAEIVVTGQYIQTADINSNFDDGSNVVGNMLDSDLLTRWSNNLSPAVAVVEFDAIYNVENVKMAFYKGDVRSTSFKLYVSSDSVNWTNIFSGSSSGSSADLETFAVTETIGQYIMIEGYGNDFIGSETWTSITEFEVWGTFSDSVENITEPVDSTIESNTAPVVELQYSQKVSSGTIGTVDGANSFDPDGDILSYNWIVPDGLSVKSLTTSQLEFLAPSVSNSDKLNISVEISDGKLSEIKNVDINVVPFKSGVKKSKIKSVSASSYQEMNYPENIIDGDLSTRWSSEGEEEWIVLELDAAYKLSHIEVTFYNRDNSIAYFDIYGSVDNMTWEPIEDNITSCGFSSDMQAYGIPETKASEVYKFIKLVGHGSSENEWNSFSDIQVFVYENSITSVDNNEIEIVDVYPIPASNFVNLSMPGYKEGDYIVSIIDISGKVISSNTHFITPDDSLVLNVSDIKRGIYFVQIQGLNNVMLSKKILVE